MDEAIEDGIGQGGIADALVPMFYRVLAGHQGREYAVAIIEDFEQIAPVLGCRPADLLPDPESVLDDRERRMLAAFKALGPDDGDYLVRVAEALAGAEAARAAAPLQRRRA